MVRSQKKFLPNNHVIYVVDTDLEFSIFFNEDLPCEPEILVPIEVKEDEEFAKRRGFETKNRKMINPMLYKKKVIRVSFMKNAINLS